jgi:monothiol glutaredoxin
MSELRERIKETIEQEPVVAFVKGTHEQVYCGNSDRALQALRGVGASFAAVDVLPDPAIRQELSALSNWPTIPQLFVNGELVGGCDIVTEMYETGELSRVLGVEPPPDAPEHAPKAAEPGAPPLQIDNNLVDRS